jgi:hypothetical protein
MDPAKTISYRRWRDQHAGNGRLTLRSFGDESNPVPHRPEKNAGTATPYGTQGEEKLKKNGADRRCGEKLFKELKREYRKSFFFRGDKVANLKWLIHAGAYHVPGKAVVDKWFSNS